MPAIAVQNAPSSYIPLPKAKVAKPISWEEFQRKYLSREDEFKYEWVNGIVVKTKRSMDKTQLYLLENLLEHFDLLKTQGKVQGRLISEPDLFFLTNHRRPDIALLSKKQIYALAEPKAYEVPAFIIEGV
jgi:Putative restriction endonuclease